MYRLSRIIMLSRTHLSHLSIQLDVRTQFVFVTLKAHTFLFLKLKFIEAYEKNAFPYKIYVKYHHPHHYFVRVV